MFVKDKIFGVEIRDWFNMGVHTIVAGIVAFVHPIVPILYGFIILLIVLYYSSELNEEEI